MFWRHLVIANPSGYPADLSTVRGRCLVFRPWCQRGCLKLPGTCLEFALSGLSRIVDESECQVTKSDILSTILNSEFQVTTSDVLSTILSSRCQEEMYCRRFWFPGVKKWCIVTDSELQVSKSDALSTILRFRCHKMMNCQRLWYPGVKKWCIVDDSECQVSQSVVSSTIPSGSR